MHDPAAAMLGGVAGNAGMFSNANDLAVLMQLLLNKGVYHNQRILKESTIQVFTEYSNLEFCRRGLGFDKPELDPKKGKPSSKYCSSASYGHSGFTGTFIWADPTNNLIYVFLSNRVNPDAANSKISQWNIRTNIQDLLYEFINEAEQNP